MPRSRETGGSSAMECCTYPVHHVAMQLLLRDPAYADRLAAFLSSLGQTAVVSAPDSVEVVGADTDTARAEMLIYLRVWRVLYPEAGVEITE